jgi:hypothetical protein
MLVSQAMSCVGEFLQTRKSVDQLILMTFAKQLLVDGFQALDSLSA